MRHVSSQQVVVVGGQGRVGQALCRSVSRAWPGAQLIQVGRGGSVPEDVQGPVYIATTNNALRTVFERTVPRSRWRDCVLLQNGMLQPLLAELQLSSPTALSDQSDEQPGPTDSITQVLLYASASADGVFTDGGRTAAAGRWAQHAAATVAAGGVSCKVVDGVQLQAAGVEKALWASMFWLMSAGLGGMQVGDIARKHRGEVEALALELLPLAVRYLRSLGAGSDSGSSRTSGTTSHRSGGTSSTSSLSSSEASSTAVTNQASSSTVYAGAADLLGTPGAQTALVAGLLDYSERIATAVPSRAMAMAEMPWRNGFFLRQLAAERLLGAGEAVGQGVEQGVQKGQGSVGSSASELHGSSHTGGDGLSRGLGVWQAAEGLDPGTVVGLLQLGLSAEGEGQQAWPQSLHEQWLVRAGVRPEDLRQGLRQRL